jgi:hypothetical protein
MKKMKAFRKTKIGFIFLWITLTTVDLVSAAELKLNDLEYFEGRGVNVMVFSNQYNGLFFDEKTAGIEVIHHGVRTVTGGGIRLQNTPEQWDLVPEVAERKVDKTNNTIEVLLKYQMFDFLSKIVVKPYKDGVLISVFLDRPLPDFLVGKAGLNLEFLPSAYFEKTYLIDGKPGVFPLYPYSNSRVLPVKDKVPQFEGFSTFDDRGRGEFIAPEPLAKGKSLILAPEDPERLIKIFSDSNLMLFDGRILAQNGWYVVRSLLPANKTGKVLEWYLEINSISDWIRRPVIGFSQVGYHPQQQKVAIIELDPNDKPLSEASVYKVTAEGKKEKVFSASLTEWGRYMRYNYVKFDFSAVKDTGLYVIQYGNQFTNAFPIHSAVYSDIWHPTLDVWFPVQMDHMKVNEGYRVWHGVPYLDDALQAPANHKHFDLYEMGPSTDSKFKPLERIPGLAIGGWFDAGDFDIETHSHCSVISSFVDAWEKFGLNRDQTYISQNERYVDIHRPDGVPDLLQQIEHGTLNLVAQVKAVGHPVRGINVPNLYQYHHLGDASTITDNLPYNPALQPYESDGKSSGTPDDRWVFTNRNISLDYQTIASLAAAARALKNYNDTLADQCVFYAKKLWEENEEKIITTTSVPDLRRNTLALKLKAAFELYITTNDKQLKDFFTKNIWTSLDSNINVSILTALQASPFMDKKFRDKMKNYVIKWKDQNDKLLQDNPYGVPIMSRGWGGNHFVINWAIINYYAARYFPEIISKEYTLRGLNYILGCHPYSNISFVSAVGVKSKKVAYGNNRADFTFIAGGVVPGLLFLKPDFLENKEDWPFFWGENEYVIGTSAAYLFLAAAAQDLILH